MKPIGFKEIDPNIKRFIPKELLQPSSTIKPIKPPKGRISSKAAYALESLISIQTEANNAAVKKQLLNIAQNESYRT